MCRAISGPAVPLASGGRFVDERGCVDTATLHDGLVRVVRWQCRHDGPEMRQEREHRDVVVSFQLAGACEVHAAGRSILVDPTRVLIFLPETPYRTTHPYGFTDRGVNVAVRRDLAMELLAEHLPDRLDDLLAGRPLCLLTARHLASAGLLMRLLAAWRQSAVGIDAASVEECALGAVDDVFRHLGAGRNALSKVSAETELSHHSLVERTRRLLLSRLGEPWTLETVAREMATSPSHLTRLFRNATGLPLYQYLKCLRLETALDRLLSEPRAHLDQIAADCGFGSHSHFTTAFSGLFGVAPTAVRRMARLRSRGEVHAALGRVAAM